MMKKREIMKKNEKNENNDFFRRPENMVRAEDRKRKCLFAWSYIVFTCFRCLKFNFYRVYNHHIYHDNLGQKQNVVIARKNLDSH